jgi:hypothetical protein
MVAAGCFFVSGLSFLLMSDYPGVKYLAEIQEHEKILAAGHDEEAPVIPIEDREDEPPEEEPLPGDEEYVGDYEKDEQDPESVPQESAPVQDADDEYVEEEIVDADVTVKNDESGAASAEAMAEATAANANEVTPSSSSSERQTPSIALMQSQTSTTEKA